MPGRGEGAGAAPGPGAPPGGPDRTWAAVTVGTLLAVVGQWAVLVASLLGADPEVLGRGAEAAIVVSGLALLAVAVAVAATLSRVGWRRAASAVLWGGLTLAVVAIALDEPVPVTAMTAGTTMGAALSLARHGRGEGLFRTVFAVATVVYVALVMRVVPSLGVVVAPFLPFLAVAAADGTSRLRSSPPAASSVP